MAKKRLFTKKTQEFYDKIVKNFVLDEHHLMILHEVCAAKDRIIQAQEAIASDGLIIGSKQHPAWAIERDARVSVFRGLRQLGLDASADPDSRHSFGGS